MFIGAANNDNSTVCLDSEFSHNKHARVTKQYDLFVALYDTSRCIYLKCHNLA